MPAYGPTRRSESRQHPIEAEGSSFPQEQDAREKLAADWQLYEAMHQEDFDGPVWRSFVEVMARYGADVTTGWIRSSAIFEKLTLRKVRGPKTWIGPFRPDGEDNAQQIADDMVTNAIRAFRDKVLRPGRWSPTGGASLKTFFITACLYEFPNAYRRWLSEQRPSNEVSLEKLAEFDPDLTRFLKPAGLVNPADIAEVRDRALRSLNAFVKDDRTRAMLYLQAQGYRQHEIAEILGVTEKAVEHALARQRQYRTTKVERR